MTQTEFTPDIYQEAQLRRCRSRIGGLVLQYLHSVGVGGEFHVASLHDFVRAKAQVAPASADRVMRDLRQRGIIRFEVVDRPASLYKLLEIR